MSQAAERLLDVVETLSLSDTPLTVMEVAGLTGLNKSTCSRLLHLLEKRELVSRDPESKRYRVGPTMLGLVATIAKRSELLRVVHPHLETIRNDVGETTSFHLKVGMTRLCVDAVDRFPPQLYIQPLGVRNPLYLGTSGLSILAYLASEEIEQQLELAELAGFDRANLTEGLDHVRQHGFLARSSYKVPRYITLSAPLFRQSTAFGSVTITAPSERWTLETAHTHASLLKERADTISSVVTSARVIVYQNGQHS